MENNTMEVSDDLDLLSELMEDVPVEPVDLSKYFGSEEKFQEFVNGFPFFLLNLWATNDKLVTLVCPPGTAEAFKELLCSGSFNVPAELSQVYATLIDELKQSGFEEHPEVTEVSPRTLKQLLATREIFEMHNWANSHSLYENLRNKQTVIQPTMEELRMLALVDCLLDMREGRSRIVDPRNMRLPVGVR